MRLDQSGWIALGATAALVSAAVVMAAPAESGDAAGAETRDVAGAMSGEAAGDAAPLAVLSGQVRTTEAPPELPPVPHTQDQSACGDTQPDGTWRVGEDGGLKNVVVELVGVDGGEPPAHGRLVLDQERCTFIPRVSAFPVGTELGLKNSDLVFHNTRANIGRAVVFNVALPLKDMELTRRVNRPGLIRFSCDAGHPWMIAWAYVTDHPWVTVTDAEGRFRFEGVPPGRYELKVWHEAAGTRQETVQVAGGGAAVDIAF